MRNKVFLFIAVILTAGALGGYFFLRQFVSDRETAMTYREPEPRRPYAQERRLPDGRTVKTYTAKELEEARKKGQLPAGAEPGNASQATTANEAAVQRSLRTIEEINRINEMNRRLQEQQKH